MTLLTRSLALIGGIAMLSAAGILVAFLHTTTEREALSLAEDHNVALSRVLANSLRDRVDVLTAPGAPDDPEQLRRRGAMLGVNSAIIYRLRDLSVVKIKIYNPAGLTVFSTEEKQIGEDKRDNLGFRQAINGKVASELTYRNRFSAFEGVIEDRNLLSSYIPIYGEPGSDQPTSVFEIYYDVTSLLAGIRTRQWYQGGTIFGVFAIVYFCLLVVALRVERTARRHHEKAIQLAAEAAHAASANRTKSEFLANMSHELRTPLNAVLGFSDMIRREMFGALGNLRYRGYAEDIHAAANHLLQIINDILDLTRVEAGKIEIENHPIELASFAKQALTMVSAQAKAGRVSLMSQLPSDLAVIHSDERLLLQVVLNLLSNAVKFTPVGGLVRLAVRRAVTGGIELTVQDTGIGIKEEDIPKALAPFSQIDNSLSRRHQGTGLGLALASRYMETLGGRLWIRSKPGKGTTVTVSLPADAVRPLSAAA